MKRGDIIAEVKEVPEYVKALTPEAKMTKCPKCGSDKIQVKKCSMPSELELGRGFPVNVNVCLNCGYGEFYFEETGYTTRPH